MFENFSVIFRTASAYHEYISHKKFVEIIRKSRGKFVKHLKKVNEIWRNIYLTKY